MGKLTQVSIHVETWTDAQRLNDDDVLIDEEFGCDRCGEVYHLDLLGLSDGPAWSSPDGLGTMLCINCARPQLWFNYRMDAHMEELLAERVELE